MSSINKALSELTEKDASIDLVRASVPELPKRKPWLWLVAGFGLSLTLGSWAVSQGREVSTSSTSPTLNKALTQEASVHVSSVKVSSVGKSPTRKSTPITNNIHVASVHSQHVEHSKPKIIQANTETKLAVANQDPNQAASQPNVTANSETQNSSLNTTATSDTNSSDTTNNVINNNNVKSAKTLQAGDLDVEQVSLTGKQLALKAEERAQKAIDSDDMQTALDAYEEAIRYDPYAVTTRQKLAALYYGKNNTRHAYDILQAGIRLDESNQVLRLSLAKMLIKAKQMEAALSPLVYLPTNPSADYLSMRAALAQKNNHNDIALKSYQLLTQMDPENARWWLGFAIQQERAVQFKAAIKAYQKALGLVGISNQSQVFIHDRLKLLKKLEKKE